MRLKSKIHMIFILSIILSVVIFIAVIGYLVNNGFWSGIKTEELNYIANNCSSALDSTDKDKATSILKSYKDKNTSIDFELLSENMSLLYSSADKQQITSMKELITSLSEHGQYSQKKWIVARQITMKNSEKCYLVLIVSAESFTSIVLYINGLKGAGILGKMFLIGLGITLTISSLLVLLLLRNISMRFTSLYKGIAAFDFGNMDIAFNDSTKDEIGFLAGSFNKMSARLKKQFEEEKVINEEKRKLVSNISHDLRTPLTSIIGYSESLENNIYEDEEEYKKYLKIIHNKSLYMDKLLEELLEISRLESKQFKLTKQEADICELIRETLIEYLPEIQKKQLELITDIPETKLTANIDKDRISRVLRNLLDNAIKYSSEETVIEVKLQESQEFFNIEINDNGCGIDEKSLDLIFKRFYRGDKSRSSKYGGMGLGLAIAEEIVKLHGGSISVDSSLGKGACFIVKLPKKKCKEQNLLKV